MFRYQHLVLMVQLAANYAQVLNAFPISRYSFDNLEQRCLYPMIVAKNGSNLITSLEVPNFIFQLSVANGIDDPKFRAQVFTDLPFELIIDYNKLICDENGDCVQGIDVAGAENLNSVSYEQQKFLEEVCAEFLISMRKVLGPSHAPSILPSSDPSSSPSLIPTNSPSMVPSPYTPPTLDIAIPFGVVNMYGFSASDIVQNVGGTLAIIEEVFQEFSDEVETDLFTQTIGGRRRMRANSGRRLAVEFDHTWVTNIKDVDCPLQILNEFKNRSPAPRCQEMQGIINYVVTEPTNKELTGGIILDKSLQGIRNDQVRAKVPDGIRDDIVFYALDLPGTSVPVAAITGITIGAALVGLVIGRMLTRRKHTRKDSSEQYDGLNGVQGAEFTMDEEEYGSNPRDTISPLSYKGMAEEALYRRDMNEMESSVDASSNAGSSGWSSSAGISSLNTASVDSAEYFGSSLAAIGAASNITNRYNKNSSGEEMYPIIADSVDESSMSESDLGTGSELETDDESNLGYRQRQFAVRDDLDNAIRTGDWSLVGATAALISQSPSDFASDANSTFSSNLSSVVTSQQDTERATELDRLVEIGDWEGVVLAAAKFEAENDKDGVTEGSASVSEGQQFLASRSIGLYSDANSTNSPSVSTNISESASNNLKRAEIRAEVEALVRRVVPDEIDNVDEMMNQFKGREEELVETLRTMQERSIAARERDAMRKNAKREARKLVKRNKLPPSAKPTSQGDQNNSSSDVDHDDTSSARNGNIDGVNLTTDRATLDYAIQIGDWEAVGKTAEQLGEGSSYSGSEYHSADDRSVDESKSTLNENDSDRASMLEGLIDRGDWSGVVAAASKFTVADNKNKLGLGNDALKSENELYLEYGDAVSQSTEAKKEETLKEEEDALAQAEIWMTIAQQSRNENSDATRGASEAADWAIQRSLRQIEATTPDNKGDAHSISSSCDDKSV